MWQTIFTLLPQKVHPLLFMKEFVLVLHYRSWEMVVFRNLKVFTVDKGLLDIVKGRCVKGFLLMSTVIPQSTVCLAPSCVRKLRRVQCVLETRIVVETGSTTKSRSIMFYRISLWKNNVDAIISSVSVQRLNYINVKCHEQIMLLYYFGQYESKYDIHNTGTVLEHLRQ